MCPPLTTEARKKEDARFAALVLKAREAASKKLQQSETLKQELENANVSKQSEQYADRKEYQSSPQQESSNSSSKPLGASDIPLQGKEENKLSNEDSYIQQAEYEGLGLSPLFLSYQDGETNEQIRERSNERIQTERTEYAPKDSSEQQQTRESATKSLQILSESRQSYPAKQVTLNALQQEARDRCLRGESICIIGAAGTGKTTAYRQIVSDMIQAGLIQPFRQNTKWLEIGKPGTVCLSFTNKAVANIARGMSKDITCITAHKLVEFEPVFYDVKNADGEMVKTMRFEPARNRFNPLPSSLSVICFEESGSISTELFAQITDALRRKDTQFIFLGDIQQLPPIFGPAILGFKMLELPVIELTEVHRQALDSPILACAWEIIAGKPMSAEYIKEKYDTENKFFFRPWKKKLSAESALNVAYLLVKSLLDANEFNPTEDMILMPFNKSFGTIELNKLIANHLGIKREAEVYEIIAGWQKHYYAVGDKVLCNKQEAYITKIVSNGLYQGVQPLEKSKKLNRWGHYQFDSKEEAEHEMLSLEEMEDLLAAATPTSENIEDKKNQASHIITVQIIGSEETFEIQTAGQYAAFEFGYALTIHKSQGSEWKKVLLFLHHTHSTMISRELLYTAVTRARESLYIVGEKNTFEVGVERQRIKGNTLAEKAEYFKGKLQDILPPS